MSKNRIKRFTLIQRISHLFLMLSFLTQGITGIGRMYIETTFGKALVWVWGGYDAARTVHITVGILFMCGLFIHGLYVLSRIDWRHLHRSLLGPDSLLPRPEDIVEAIQHVCWIFHIDKLVRLDRWGYLKKLDSFLLRIIKVPPMNRWSYLKDWDSVIGAITKPPQFDRWTYWEKFDYWAVFWGIPVLGVTGLLLAYPLFASKLIPGWGLNLAFWVHRIEAILAMGHVFIIHFFIGHLRRHNFPMDLAMFEGSVDLEAARHEKAIWVERMKQAGKLKQALVPAASLKRRAVFYIYGYTALAIGIFLLVGGLVNSTSITW